MLVKREAHCTTLVFPKVEEQKLKVKVASAEDVEARFVSRYNSNNKKTNKAEKVEYARGEHFKKYVLEDLDESTLKSDGPVKLKDGMHGLIGAALTAFAQHAPLRLRPDDLFQTILEGVALHAANGGPKLVSFEGKQKIEIRRDDFVKGSDQNKWHEVFPAFVEKIVELSGSKLCSLVMDTRFSTTTDTDVVSRSVVLMDIMQKYFTYVVSTRCGFPSIELMGTSEDWQLLLTSIPKLEPYLSEDLAKVWLPALLDIVGRMMATVNGKDTEENFWQSMVKYDGHNNSGEKTAISGWINVFYPYVANAKSEGSVLNQYVLDWVGYQRLSKYDGNRIELFGRTFATAPFIWDYYGTQYPMNFKSGFVGASLDKAVVAPCLGWAITEYCSKEEVAKAETQSHKRKEPSEKEWTEIPRVKETSQVKEQTYNCNSCRQRCSNGPFLFCATCGNLDLCMGCVVFALKGHDPARHPVVCIFDEASKKYRDACLAAFQSGEELPSFGSFV